MAPAFFLRKTFELKVNDLLLKEKRQTLGETRIFMRGTIGVAEDGPSDNPESETGSEDLKEYAKKAKSLPNACYKRTG